MTLYVESNFLLEIVLGQEESAAAERLLTLAETGVIDLVLPSFSLSEPLIRVRRSVRDRKRLLRQINDQVVQLARSTPHKGEVDVLQSIPDLFASIEQREINRLIKTVERLLAVARLIELDLPSFRSATRFQARFDLEIEDAIIFSMVVNDLQSESRAGPHIFANRNVKDFSNPSLISELKALNCDVVWSFDAVISRLG